MCFPSGSEEQQPLLQPLLGGGQGSGGGRAAAGCGGAPVHAVVAVRGMQCSCCAVAVERAIRCEL